MSLELLHDLRLIGWGQGRSVKYAGKLWVFLENFGQCVKSACGRFEGGGFCSCSILKDGDLEVRLLRDSTSGDAVNEAVEASDVLMHWRKYRPDRTQRLVVSSLG